MMTMTLSVLKLATTRRRRVMRAAAIAAVMAALTAGAQAQLRSLKMEVTPAVPEGQTFRAGAKGTVTLQVKLPDTVHVQSDKPLDKSLIPTALTIEAPSGVRVEKIVYPTATTLKQEGQKAPRSRCGARRRSARQRAISSGSRGC